MKKLLKDNLVKRIVFSGIVLIFVYWIFNNLAMFGSVIGNFVGIIMPFITGLVIAFIFNVPMRFIEKQDSLAAEVPVSLVYNGIAHTVMMCSHKI